MATELVRGLINVRPQHQGAAITIGNFDGIHLGHQALLTQLQQAAKAIPTKSGLILFEPQPLEFFSTPNAAPPSRLMPWREKFHFLSQKNLDFILLLHFNAALAKLEAPAFIEQVLVGSLAIKHILVGDDFRFGKGRSGDKALLTHAGATQGFTVEAIHSFLSNGRRVSSSAVRQALSGGDLNSATELLGHPYFIRGRIVDGDKLGRKLGCPTANIRIKNCPLHGIYTVKVHGIARDPLPGVASVGIRPSVGGEKMILEVHILDFTEDIYGRVIGVEFLSKLRDEEYYPSLHLLKEQIKKDVEATREFFKR